MISIKHYSQNFKIVAYLKKNYSKYCQGIVALFCHPRKQAYSFWRKSLNQLYESDFCTIFSISDSVSDRIWTWNDRSELLKHSFNVLDERTTPNSRRYGTPGWFMGRRSDWVGTLNRVHAKYCLKEEHIHVGWHSVRNIIEDFIILCPH